MPGLKAAVINFSKKVGEILTKIFKGTHTPAHLKKRAEIILLSDKGETNNSIEETMGIDGESVTTWRNRFSGAQEELARVESEEPRKLRAAIEKTLSDETRSGRPATFTDEQIAGIVALACEQPEQLDLPFSHWTPSLLRDEVIKREIVPSISAVHIGRILKKKDLRPHKVKTWLNPKIEDQEAFAAKTREISELYIDAAELEEEGIHVYSTDEKMGIQAREHKNPAIPMSEGHAEKIDPEYIRHGTTGIIATRNVATGEIVEPFVQPTRTEEDYAKHIEAVVETAPEDGHVFVNDNLNTHKSETLVRFVAKKIGFDAAEF